MGGCLEQCDSRIPVYGIPQLGNKTAVMETPPSIGLCLRFAAGVGSHSRAEPKGRFLVFPVQMVPLDRCRFYPLETFVEA